MKIHIRLTILLVIISFCSNAQVVPFNNLFLQKTGLKKDFHSIASDYQSLQLNQQNLLQLRGQLSQNANLQLPFENKDLSLDLVPATITANNFSVIEASGSGNRAVSYTLPSFYQGKIKGEDKSFATLSLFDGQAMGVFSDSKSNIVLGAIEENGKATNDYALYRDLNLKIQPGITCFTSDSSATKPLVKSANSSSRVLATGDPIEIYFECDYKFYQDKGSNINNVVNYVLGFFNSVALLYAREDIIVQVSQIKVWTTADPYVSLTTTSSILTAFSTNMQTDPYVGDFAHFLSTRSLGGGVAFRSDDPCLGANARRYRSAVSAVSNTYQNFPTYSWTVNVVTHELGHNFGSPHTHWCGWVGGPIDGCGPTANASYAEGTCATGPIPSSAVGGTIMSYCHLLGGVGIKLSNGFGQQPGDMIRSVLSSSSCFGTCKMIVSTAKVNASCGQNNGSIAVTATNGTGAYSYAWSNSQTGATLSNAAPGVYSVVVTDAAGCKITRNDTITNAGTTLVLNLTPASASICSGNSVLLSATSNPAYTYKWFKNTVQISGATMATYTATAGGDYSVEAASGSCVVTKSVTVTEATQPVAGISATGSTNFCTGNSVTLNASPASGYQYQWYRGGTAISAATTNSYIATTAGNYNVRVYAGSCESYSSNIAVSVVTSPNSVITSNGALSFCPGGSVALTASNGAGYTYQWYRNSTIITGATQINYTANTSGSYTVVVSLGTCSKTSPATNVTVFANPTIDVNPDSVTIEKFDTQLITATGASTYNWSAQPALVNNATAQATVMPLTTTIYTIDGVDNNGCHATATAKVIVIGCGDATNFTDTAYSPSRVLLSWTNPQGVIADTVQYRMKETGELTTIYTNNSSIELNGLLPNAEYEYQVITLCNTTNTFVASAVQAFKTPALTSGIYLKVFPNPARESARLEVIMDKPYSMQAEVINQAGQKVMQVSPTESLPAGQTIRTINTAQLPAGLYHLTIRINGKLYSKKFIVQK